MFDVDVVGVCLPFEMPLFSNKFSPKKTPVRKQILSSIKRDSKKKLPSSLTLETEPLKLKLGEQECIFEDGDWIPGMLYLL